MSYHEKRAIVMSITGLAVLAAYCFYAFGQVQAGMAAFEDLKFWARTILIFIGIGIAATIVIQIIFHILLSVSTAVSKHVREGVVDEKEIERSINAEMVEDEMNRLVELKASRVGYIFTGIGFVAGLIALLLNFQPAVLINSVFIAASLGTILEGFAQLFYYRRGVQHA